MTPVNGLLLLDKPEGCTSFDVVEAVRRKIGIQKVGHAGTLDPFATGLLLILLGPTTKRAEEFLGLDKTYTGCIRLGVSTDTGDPTGRILQQAPLPKLTREDAERVFADFQGERLQTPPMYSAIKKGGQRLYTLARKGITIERAPRRIHIHALTLLEFHPSEATGTSFGRPLEILFKAHVSSGTYIRTLAEEIALALNTAGHLTQLKRISISKWSLKEAMGWPEFERASKEEVLLKIRPHHLRLC